ncbi:MAG: hypothetical protein WAU78_08905 [Roseiarcus sp.]
MNFDRFRGVWRIRSGNAGSASPFGGAALNEWLHKLAAQLGKRGRAGQFAVTILLLSGAAARPEGSPPIVIDLGAPSNYWLAAGTSSLLPIKPAHGLVDLPAGNIGWFEFSFTSPDEGWRRLAIEARPYVGRVELDIDAPPLASQEHMAVSGSLLPGDWVWLDAGAHRLRVIQNFFVGMPQVTGIRLEAPEAEQPGVFRVISRGDRPVAAIGHCAPLRVESGGTGKPSTIEIVFKLDDRLMEAREIAVPATAHPETLEVDVPCSRPGDITAFAWTLGARQNPYPEPSLRYSVFDTRRVEPEFRRTGLVVDIDATTRDPEFGSGSTAVARGPAGVYRETIDKGMTVFARSGEKSEAPGWFAYRLKGLTPGKPYLFEVEYPDDAPRVFVAAFRDSAELGSPTSIGAETGVIWPLSRRMMRMDAVVWPASSDVRALVFNVHDGMRAAVSHIRIYALETEDRASLGPRDGREVVAWYEEGDDFRSLVGESHDRGAVHTPVDRFLRVARSMGATTVSPTLLIYDFELYPSKFNLIFNDEGEDVAAAFLLGAERYGMKVVPELHPRADELLWPARDQASLDHRLLLSGKGATNLFAADGSRQFPPYFNALDTDVRRWYLGVIRELAERYRDYPAFGGIQLRISNWANSGLNNLVSIDWGYNAATVRRFFDDTGAPRPAALDLDDDSAAAARSRRDLLLVNLRQSWVRWRCEQIRDVYRDIVASVRSVRPDLKVYVALFEPWLSPEGLRETGIDPDLLNAIDGLVLVDGRFSHGARQAEVRSRLETQSEFLRAGVVDSLAPSTGRPSTILEMQYIEIPGDAWPSSRLGWRTPTHEPWVSSASEPPGRLKLSRYAELVGLFDVYVLGDGGNGYVFSGEGLKDFMTEFHAIPREHFERIAGVHEPLIVRERGDLFYVVNLSPDTISARLVLDHPGRIVRLVTGTDAAVVDRVLTIEMVSYELLTFRSIESSRVVSADVIHDSEGIIPVHSLQPWH